MKIKTLKHLFLTLILLGVFVIADHASAAVLRKPPNNLGLVGYWSLNDGVGTKAGDSSGRNKSGTLTNMESTDWVNGKRGKALDFGGSDEYVDLGDFTAIESQSQITYSAWIKPNGAQEDFGGIFGKQTSVSSETSIGLGGSGTADSTAILFVIRNGGNTYGYTGTGAAPVGVWTHVVGVFDGTQSGNNAAALKIYINGVSQTLTYVGTIPATTVNNATALTIGQVAAFQFKGIIDEARAYNRALSQSDVIALYKTGAVKIGVAGKTVKINHSQNTRIANGLVGQWSFNGPDLSVSTAFDRSGQGNNGTVTVGGYKPLIGKVGQALDFDGIDDTVTINTSIGNFGTGDFTASAWVKPTTLGTRFIFSKRSACSHGSFWNMNINAGVFSAEVDQDAGATNYIALAGATQVSVGVWYHVAMVRSGATLKLYVNGIEDDSDSAAGTANISNAASTRIGQSPCSSNFAGPIDEVRIYTRALSPSEVYQLYNMGR